MLLLLVRVVLYKSGIVVDDDFAFVVMVTVSEGVV